jgi:beta-lactamase class C
MLRWIAATVLLATACVAQAQAVPVASIPAEIDSEFARILDEAGVPGGAFVVVQGDRIAHASTHGVRVSGEPDPVTIETVFRLASVSKTFAAQMTGMLVADGALGWDEPVVEYVPELRFARADHARQLRIQDLLGQSTGIVPNAYDNLLNANQGLEQIVPRFAELEPMCAPGSCYTYQNVLFALVEPAIARSTGLDYGQLVQDRLLTPLDMRNASVGIDGFRRSSDRAAPHVRRGTVWWPTEVNENYYRVASAAGVNASALDLAQWLIAQLGHRPDVIDPLQVENLTHKRMRTLRDLRRRGWRDMLSDAHYGLGWRIYTIGDEDLYLHSGWVRGFVAEVAYSRDRQIGLAVLLNAESSAMNEFTTGFWQQVLAEQPPALVEVPGKPIDAGVKGASTASESSPAAPR